MVQSNAQLKYPVTRKAAQMDNYFGTEVHDPYRWLEDDNSAETAEWVKAQNQLTRSYLDAIPFRSKVHERLTSMWNYTRFSSPFKQGRFYYYYRNEGLQNQSVLYRQISLDGDGEVFLDPNTLSKDGTAVPGVPVFTNSNRYCAYLMAESGSDWQEAYVMDVETKKLLKDKLQWIKFSGIAWKGEEGFYYSRYPETADSNRLNGKNEFHRLCYHKLGTPQSEDVVVFEDKDNPLRTITGGITEDNRYLIVNKSEGTSGVEIWVKDLQAEGPFRCIIKGYQHEAEVIDNNGSVLLVRTNIDAPNYRIVGIDMANPEKERWTNLVPEKPFLLENAQTAGGSLYAGYLKDAGSKVFQYDLKGTLLREISLPGIGTAAGFSGKRTDEELFYTYTSFNTPPVIYRYSPRDGNSTLFRKPTLAFNTSEYETRQEFFRSTDGARVPLFITYKKGLKLNGKNPLMLYGYGGFNIPLTPAFSISNAFFLEQGGVYVQVNLRGGNEYGEAWHKAGMLGNKQQVFDDMIAAAEFLVAKRYTSPGKLAIRGGSNGGLLVGACMTQRPDLFRVAIPQVGVLDMLRFHLFTIGWAWVVEYGSSANEKDFAYLYRYSPLHNLKKGVKYPATLVTTADHDDRVVPAHSFKFAATLQEMNDGTNPTLIRIDVKAGHGAGKPTAKVIDEAADIWSFVMDQLGMSYR
jgi:prolyl oligopeptidase